MSDWSQKMPRLVRGMMTRRVDERRGLNGTLIPVYNSPPELLLEIPLSALDFLLFLIDTNAYFIDQYCGTESKKV